jgi:pimeloyl-ACP methyl ester carboxylesterase
MPTVTSADGTTIGYSKTGSGPAMILVDGAMTWREMGPNGDLAKALAGDFTVYTWDRRGRGQSGDTAPYALEREVEDIAALIAEAGGHALLYGISSGGALAIEAARRLDSVDALLVYEVPYVVDDTRPPVPDDYARRMDALLAAGDRGGAVKLFMREGVGLPAAMVAMMRLMPSWRKLTSVAHTLPYDISFTVGDQRGRPYAPGRFDGISAPVLVVDGGKSPAAMRNAMKALAATLPGATYETLPGQTHLVKAAALAPVLTAFAKASASRG